MREVIIVTGASSGLGKHIQATLQRRGVEVIGISRRGPCKLDITAIPSDFFQEKLEGCKVMCLINCAGIMPFEETSKTMDVNFWGAVNMINILDPYFGKNASIINVASISGMKADLELPIYSASKAALIAYSKSIAKKYINDPRKIRVNCISPGLFRSNLVPGETPKEIIDNVPAGFEASPSHLMLIILELITNKFIVGSNFVIDGGELL